MYINLSYNGLMTIPEYGFSRPLFIPWRLLLMVTRGIPPWPLSNKLRLPDTVQDQNHTKEGVSSRCTAVPRHRDTDPGENWKGVKTQMENTKRDPVADVPRVILMYFFLSSEVKVNESFS
jgi:hypothetical protein